MPEKSLRTPEILTTNQKVPGETLKVKVHPIPIKKYMTEGENKYTKKFLKSRD